MLRQAPLLLATALVAMAIAMAANPPPTAEAAEVLANPDFEDWSPGPDSWIVGPGTAAQSTHTASGPPLLS